MSNDFAPGLRQVLVRNGSYYLVAHQRPPDDGRFRRWTVKVNRPDVEVITRRLYESPNAEPEGKRPPEPPADVAALAGIVPDSTLPLRVTAAAFAKDDGGATLALTVGIRQLPVPARTPETVDVIVRAFTADGDPKGAESSTIPLTLPAARAGADASRYDVLARIDVDKPGKYEVRLSVGSELSASRGSVYVDVDVPDFRKDPVSMSGLLVSAFPSAGAVAPARAFSELTSMAPTSERTFDATHVVTAIGRVYQGGRGEMRPVTLKTSVRDAKNAVVNERTLTVDAPAFGADRSAPLELRIPTAGLSAGQHLFTVEVVGARTPVRRDVVFTIR
jgi:hypothetical protein